jgi:hypothetical protein
VSGAAGALGEGLLLSLLVLALHINAHEHTQHVNRGRRIVQSTPASWR